MTDRPAYSRYQPRTYEKRMPIFWWVHKRQHVRFILRELTSVFIAAYVVVLILLLRAIVQGPEAYEAFMAAITSPVSLVLHAVIFAFAVYHTITWFNLAPSAMVIKLGGRRVPPGALVAGNFVAWAILSIALAWIVIAS